jgi:hypothetical protein
VEKVYCGFLRKSDGTGNGAVDIRGDGCGDDRNVEDGATGGGNTVCAADGVDNAGQGVHWNSAADADIRGFFRGGVLSAARGVGAYIAADAVGDGGDRDWLLSDGAD